MKINVIIYCDSKQLSESRLTKALDKDRYGHLNCTDSEKVLYFGEEYPFYEETRCFNDKVRSVTYRDECYLLIKSDLPSKQLGIVEYAIYCLTGSRGIGHHINSLEILSPPNSQLKKYLFKRI